MVDGLITLDKLCPLTGLRIVFGCLLMTILRHTGVDVPIMYVPIQLQAFFAAAMAAHKWFSFRSHGCAQ